MNVPVINATSQYQMIAQALLEECTYLFAGEDAYNLSYLLTSDYIRYVPAYEELPATLEDTWTRVDKKEYIKILAAKVDNDTSTAAVIDYGEGYVFEFDKDKFRTNFLATRNATIVAGVFESLLSVFVSTYASLLQEHTLQYALKYTLNTATLDSVDILSSRIEYNEGTPLLIVNTLVPAGSSFGRNQDVWITQDTMPVKKKMYVDTTTVVQQPIVLQNAIINEKEIVSGVISGTLSTINTLTGSYTTQQLVDRVIKNVYQDATEIIVDYTDFENFVLYGSAKNRLLAFEQKLEWIEDNDTSIAALQLVSGSTESGSVVYNEIVRLSNESNVIVSSFDSYEN